MSEPPTQICVQSVAQLFNGSVLIVCNTNYGDDCIAGTATRPFASAVRTNNDIAEATIDLDFDCR
jgi:hypothetical protein